MAEIPLIGHSDPRQAVAYRGAIPISAAEFVADVRRVASSLPQGQFLVNFCNDRYNFAVGFGAALMRDQVSLLPPNRTPAMLEQLREEYRGLYALVDDASEAALVDRVVVAGGNSTVQSPLAVPAFAEDQVAAIAFTSGSTGSPTPHRKTWGGLARGALGEAKRLQLHENTPTTLVGTVPPQHMYGLESSLLMALRNGLSFHSARPFYPLDIRTALEDIKQNRVLITTPFHLRALLAEQLELPPLRLIVSATAMLAPDLAQQAEVRYGAPLHEVYGFTEAGMVATRRTTEGLLWHALPDVTLRRDGEEVRVLGGHVEIEVMFTDAVELYDSRSFVLRGRNSDLVNIAGKRTSLGYLNHQLNSITGVRDGVFFMPEETGSVTRLTAFVVAPELSRDVLLATLRARIDDVFMPRPLHLVNALPRNASGKLPRNVLDELARSLAVKTKRENTA